jgi:hypothetical protein
LKYAKETMTDKVFFRSESEATVKKAVAVTPEPVREVVYKTAEKEDDVPKEARNT